MPDLGGGSVPLLSPDDAIRGGDVALVEVLDRLLDHGVVLRGELWLTVADVDLVFIGADLVLASPERMARTPIPPPATTQGADGVRPETGAPQ
ncbi:MAG: gas vesicle protein [Pseudomonadota bacterium]